MIPTVKGFGIVNKAEIEGSIKDRNGMDLTEAEDIKKRWQEYTEGLYKKGIHHQDNHDGMITHLEPDILVCEVKWALESITKLMEVMEFQLMSISHVLKFLRTHLFLSEKNVER